jgi:P-type Ca2+ transporter type 2C
VLRDGVQSVIDAEELVPGDVILLDPGAHVPADVRLVEARALRVEESALTGESVPVTKSVESVDIGTPLAERTSMVLLGTTVTAGRAAAIVTATGEGTELGKIGRLVRNVETEPTPLEQRLAALGRRSSASASPWPPCRRGYPR